MNESKFIEKIKQIDIFIQSKPTPHLLKKVTGFISNEVLAKYFFFNLEDPNWLELLKSSGLFSKPPEPIYDEAQNIVSLPNWPQSHYLARMATKAPEKVCEIILEIPEIDNANIHEDFVEAALSMPPDLAAKIAEKEIEWLRKQEELYLLLPDKLGGLIGYLAKEEKIEVALELAYILLEIKPNLAPPETHEITRRLTYPKIKVKFDTWLYEEILKKHITVLAEKAPEKTLNLVCKLLETAIKIEDEERANKKVGDKSADFSYIWRPAIEDHEQNRPHDLKNMLVSSVRDILERIVQKDHQKLPTIVKWLEEREYPIFRRIALHILRIFPESPQDIIIERLTDRSIFDCRHLRHEYALLLKEKFDQLPPGAQQKIMSWIEEGPDVKAFRERYESDKSRTPTGDEVKRYIKSWQIERLSWIKDSLPEKWKEYYKELVDELGEPEFPEFVSVVTTWVGPESPKTVDELRSWPVSEIVEYLKDWKPPKDSIRGPSFEGLGRTLAQVVTEDPIKFAEEAEKFIGLDPTYVRYLVSGLRDAVKAGRAFNWEKVLELCRWAVEQPRDITGEKREMLNKDPHWGWARKAIADLLSVGFIPGQNEKAEIPIEFKGLVWSILEPITNDPEPTPEDETEYGGTNMDPVTYSINTTRGEAMHAVIRYALWCKRHLGFKRIEDVPNIKNTLELHLDPDLEPSLAVRSVYGQWLPQLVRIDRNWVSRNLDKLFPKETDLRLWEATWASYIETSRPYVEVYEVLLEEYRKAIGHIGKWDYTQMAHFQDPDERLTEHLLVLYSVGAIGIEDSVFTSFWEVASDDLRAHAIEFIGRSLRNYEGEVSQELLKKVKLLWEWRLTKAINASNKENHKKEITAFGWWFASGKFEDKWAFEQLMKALKFSRCIEPPIFVVQRLAELANAFPQEVAMCFNGLVSGDLEKHKIFGWRRDAKELLGKTLKSDDEKARSLAEEAISRLAAMGFLEFVNLLKE